MNSTAGVGVLMLMTIGCAPVEPVVGEPAVAEREAVGQACNAAPAQSLVGRPATSELGGEAMRLTGAKALRWIPEGGMVTMDYRTDRVNIDLDRRNIILGIRCG